MKFLFLIGIIHLYLFLTISGYIINTSNVKAGLYQDQKSRVNTSSKNRMYFFTSNKYKNEYNKLLNKNRKWNSEVGNSSGSAVGNIVGSGVSSYSENSSMGISNSWNNPVVNSKNRIRVHSENSMEYRKYPITRPVVTEKSLNKITLIGRVGCEPEIKILSGGDKVASFSLATNEYWKDKNTHELKYKTDWHRIVVYDQGLVELVHKYLKKGRRIYIQGSLQYRKWFSNDLNNAPKQITEIVLSYNKSDLIFLDERRNFNNQGETGTAVGNGSPFNYMGNNVYSNRRNGRTGTEGMNRNDMIMEESNEKRIMTMTQNENSINDIEEQDEEGRDNNTLHNTVDEPGNDFSSTFNGSEEEESSDLSNNDMESSEGIYDKMSQSDFEE